VAPAGERPARPEPGDGATPTDILHLDMDCFFAAVEVLSDPALAGRPVVVGGTGGRGVVASASYEARWYGIRSAMPTAEARRLCPNAVFLPGRHAEYGAVSRRLLEILRSVTPLVEPISLDEAYLDVSGAHRLGGSSRRIAEELRRRVHEQLGLSCSVGVGRTKLVAKLASEAAKPRAGPDGPVPGPGVVVVGHDEELDFLHAHAVRALPGVGPRTAERLKRFGVQSVGDLAVVGRESLVRLLGASHGGALHDLAWGRDARAVEPDRATRSIGHEETFAADERDPASLASRAREMAVAVAARCREAEVAGRTVTVKVRFGDFSTVTRSRTLSRAATTAAEIGDVAGELLAALELRQGVRLLGVHVSGLVPADLAQARQLSLFAGEGRGEGGEELARRGGVESAADEIRRRYGSDAVTSLASAARREPAPRREAEEGDGPRSGS